MVSVLLIWHKWNRLIVLSTSYLSEEKKEEVCVIGGAELFKATFPYVDRLYITKINHEFEGDTFFPDFKEADWKIISQEKGPKDEKNPYDYSFNIYERNEDQL